MDYFIFGVLLIEPIQMNVSPVWEFTNKLTFVFSVIRCGNAKTAACRFQEDLSNYNFIDLIIGFTTGHALPMHPWKLPLFIQDMEWSTKTYSSESSFSAVHRKSLYIQVLRLWPRSTFHGVWFFFFLNISINIWKKMNSSPVCLMVVHTKATYMAVFRPINGENIIHALLKT